ncbi:MAG: tRNA (adenosine(37)-N6)-threonylcarbamoyltransferase complex ATPase subunit type 1 TsaE [Bacteroidetes bacterium]|nr:tRNA (adenosine(37)-N6)-threonylcarbamoyltransferase complex ATPase subunit type 1 TsaE [Bacteroidota bacterium]
MVCIDPAALDEVAEAILKAHPDQRVFAMYGEMGAGKTTLIKKLCQNLGVKDTVSSPTFALVNVYNNQSGEIYHYDVYRMKTIEELFDIGYEDYFFSGNFCFIEWAEKIEPFLPEETVYISIDVNAEDGSRLISF